MNIQDILAKHKKWLNGEAGGECANLRGANLSDANLSDANLSDTNLSGANLSGADLSGADLSDANLSDADLSGANLSDANLRSANLSDADLSDADLSGANLSDTNLRGADLSGTNLSGTNLTPIRDDVWAVLSGAPAEVPGLLAALREGRVEGSTYEGECACLVGTLANVMGQGYTTLENVKPDASRPAERFFLLIRKGDTPETSEPCRIAEEWVNNWLTRMQAAFGSK